MTSQLAGNACPECAEPVRPGAGVCPHCGHAFKGGARWKRERTHRVLVFLAVLAAGCIVLVVVFQNATENSRQKSDDLVECIRSGRTDC